MPSPIGHALGGFIAGWLVAGPPPASPVKRRLSPVVRSVGFAAVGMAADLDLLLHRHSQFTHSVGAALVVFATAAVLLHGRRRWLALALAVAAAYASHPFLDWLGADATPPLGIMALWPFSRDYFLSHADIFLGISREPWKPGAVQHDLLAILREVAILAPLALGAWWVRRSGRGETAFSRQEMPYRDAGRRPGESGSAQ